MFPNSLRAQLVLSFAAVILLCLVLAGSAFAYMVQPYQSQQALNRLGSLAVPLAVQVRILEVQGAGPADIGAFLEDQADDLSVRLLLVRDQSSVIVYDTGRSLAGHQLAYDGRRSNSYSPVVQGFADFPGEGRYAIVQV